MGIPPPPQLPADWVAQWDATYKQYFYVYVPTGKSQWEMPVEAPGYAPPAGPPAQAPVARASAAASPVIVQVPVDNNLANQNAQQQQIIFQQQQLLLQQQAQQGNGQQVRHSPGIGVGGALLLGSMMGRSRAPRTVVVAPGGLGGGLGGGRRRRR